jgi:hypothetical protein
VMLYAVVVAVPVRECGALRLVGCGHDKPRASTEMLRATTTCYGGGRGVFSSLPRATHGVTAHECLVVLPMNQVQRPLAPSSNSTATGPLGVGLGFSAAGRRMARARADVACQGMGGRRPLQGRCNQILYYSTLIPRRNRIRTAVIQHGAGARRVSRRAPTTRPAQPAAIQCASAGVQGSNTACGPGPARGWVSESTKPTQRNGGS